MTYAGTVIEGEWVVRAIDEFPALMIAALRAEGVTEVRGASELRVKETDRIAVMAAELRKLGAVIHEQPDGFIITGPQCLSGAVVDGHDDHRVAMALVLAGLVADGRRSSPTRAALGLIPRLCGRCNRSARMSWRWPVVSRSAPARLAGGAAFPRPYTTRAFARQNSTGITRRSPFRRTVWRTRSRYVDEGFRGFNVTIPHKRAVLDLPQIAEISDAARAIGAANTLTVRPDGTLSADNTDWEGFTRDLRMYRIQPDQLNCLILGTGGSADAVVYALEQLNARSITLISRAPEGGPT